MTQPPTRLGEFDILRELGRGGMGVVYEAVQTSLGRRVALKVLAGGLGMTPKAVDRFRREAAAAAKLHHSNIVPVYATGEQDGTHFYAMELIDGPSLDRVLKQLREAGRQRERPEDLKFANPPVAHAPGSPNQTIAYVEGPGLAAEAAGLSSSSLSSGAGYFDAVARMLAGAADALQVAHSQGVVHRDINPIRVQARNYDRSHSRHRFRRIQEIAIVNVRQLGKNLTIASGTRSLLGAALLSNKSTPKPNHCC